MSQDERATARGVVLLVGLCLVPTLVLAALWQTPRAPHAAVPARHRDGGYAGSGACKSCHPGEHASWGATFHRTMTRAASDSSFEPTLPTRLEQDERSYEIARGAQGVVGKHTLAQLLGEYGRGWSNAHLCKPLRSRIGFGIERGVIEGATAAAPRPSDSGSI